MKNNLENSIKQSLENYELPYNSSAWEAMSQKLDAGASASGDTGSSVENAIKSSLENHSYPYNPKAWTAMEAALSAGAGATVGAGIEEAMKSSLGNHEMPYNPEAWNSLESKLDGGSSGGSNWKWYVAASTLITAAAVSYFVLSDSNSNKETNSNDAQIAQTSNGTNTSNAKQSNNTTSKANETSTSGALNNNVSGAEGSTTGSGSESGGSTLASTTPSDGGTDGSGTGAISGGEPGVTPPLIGVPAPPIVTPPVISEPTTVEFIMPDISTVCQGAYVQVANENDYSMMIVFPNGSTWTGKANATTNLIASMSGIYKVGHLNEGTFVERGSFVANDAPTADFEFVNLDEKYLDGLPTTEVFSTSPGVSHEWKFGKQTASGTEATPHFFTKGDHEIELTVTGSTGCESTVTKTVTIDKNYNLLAMNAFDPRSLDSRNNTYIPRALKERKDVKFTMIIVDPEDGHIMYETSDASQGWDGVDRTTGIALEYTKSFIWKVTIENPKLGERPVYGGSAVIVPRQN